MDTESFTLEVFDPRCDTEGCLARAGWSVVSSSNCVVSRHCRKHAPGALLDKIKAATAHHPKPAVVRS